MKSIPDCFTTRRFYHLRVMRGRRITKRKCILLLICACFLVCVFTVSYRYGRSDYEAQQNTELHGSEEIYSKSFQSKFHVVKDSKTGRRIPVLSSDGMRIPVLSSDGRRIPELSSDGRRIPELSSDGRRIPLLSTDGRRINPAENKSITATPPILSYEEIQRLSYKELEDIFDRVQNWFTIQNEPEKDPLLNRHQFTFQRNSRLCASHVDILIFVHSATQNVKQREEIRKTWGSVKQYKNVSIVTVFMLGESNNSLLNQKMAVESVTYGDIVQGNFLDSYRNMTYKHVMALHWIMTQCNDVKTIVKVDDDVFINIYKLINFSVSTGHVHNKLYCSVIFHYAPIRDVRDKYYTPHDMYPFQVHPTYCEGLAYIMSADGVTKLYKASEDTRFYWIDDVYVTGILAPKAGIGHFAAENFYKQKRIVSDIAFKDHMFYLGYDDWSDIWGRILSERNIYD